MGLGTAGFTRTRASAEERGLGKQAIELRPPKLGVALFNNPAAPTSGRAVVAGRAPIVFESRSELPSDVLWICVASDVQPAQNFRSSDFLRTQPRFIAEDLGVQLDDDLGLPEVARCVGSIRDIAAQSYAWTDFSRDWSHGTLVEAISRILPSRGAVAETCESPFNQAIQSFSVVQDQEWVGDAMAQFTLRTNRLSYAQWLLSGQFPVGVWYLEAGRPRLESLLDPERPCLVEASIEFESSALGDGVTPALIAFGSSSSGRGRSVIRRWISQPELAWLIRYARIHVNSVLYCREAQPLPQQFGLPPMLLADPLLTLSVAAGVVAECHWVAVASGTFAKRPGPGATSRFVSINHPIGIWIRALDRAYCFALARKAASMGFAVTRYGYGAVTVWSSKEDLRPLFELSAALNTCHPNLAAMCKRIGFDPMAGDA